MFLFVQHRILDFEYEKLLNHIDPDMAAFAKEKADQNHAARKAKNAMLTEYA